MRLTLEARFQPALLDITDDSARHAGHAGASPGGETHYSVHMVSTGLHALALRLQSPEEVAEP